MSMLQRGTINYIELDTGVLFFLLGKKIFLKLLYGCLGSLIYGHSKLSHSPRLRSAPIQNSKTLHFTNTENTVFKEAWRVCCALVLWLWENRPYESTSLHRQEMKVEYKGADVEQVKCSTIFTFGQTQNSTIHIYRGPLWLARTAESKGGTKSSQLRIRSLKA